MAVRRARDPVLLRQQDFAVGAEVRQRPLLEQKHGLSSAEFYERYQRGVMGDEIESMRWATKFEIYEEMKEDLDKTFSLLEQYALPAPA